MLFQFKKCFHCEYVQIQALPGSFNIKGPDRNRDEAEGEEKGGSCWVSADGLTQFQGTQWSQGLISKRQIVILSSTAPVWWVHPMLWWTYSGGGAWDWRRGPHNSGHLWWEGIESETVWNAFEMHWNEKRVSSYGCHWNPFRQALNWFWPDWVGEQAQDQVNRPRQWSRCRGDGLKNPVPRTTAASPCSLKSSHSPKL